MGHKLKKVRAIYPGSFDPITNGHIDIIERSICIFDEVVIAILVNPEKKPLFTIEERKMMIEKLFEKSPRVKVDTFDGLLVEYAERIKASVIIRGIRAVSDFEYEFQMALMNRRLSNKIETVFMMPAESYTFLSSKLVKEVFMLGGSLEGLIPDIVNKALREKFKIKK